MKQSIKALKIIDDMQAGLVALGWEESKSKEFVKNLEGSLSQTAKIVESLRSHMGDAHGTKPVVDVMVLNSIRWASVLCSFLAKPA